MLNVTIDGVSRLQAAGLGIDKARKVFSDILAKTMKGFANRTRSTIIRDYLSGGPDKLKPKSGLLSSRIGYLFTESGNEKAVSFGTDVPYAPIHELGGVTPAHQILPRRANVLRFVMGGRVVFARSVQHPGSHIRARPFLRPGVEDNLPTFTDQVGDLIESAVAGGFGG